MRGAIIIDNFGYEIMDAEAQSADKNGRRIADAVINNSGLIKLATALPTKFNEHN